MGTAVASETKLGASNIEKLKNFAVEMLKGPKTCHVCQTIEKTIDFDLALFFLDWKPAATAICTELSKKYKMSEQNCFDVIKRYIVGLKTSFYRLEIQARSNFFCGYIFGLCHIDKIEKISVKPIIEALYKDQPAPQDPVPTGRSTIKILQFTDPHLDSEYQVDSIEDCTGSVMCCRKDSKPRNPTKITKAGIWGSHGYGSCDLPIQTFDAFLRFAKKEINPDIILWTGDNEHHEIDQVTQKYNYDITKYIADKTKATFPDKRIQFAIGNHEHFPVDNLDMVAPHETKGIWFYDNFTSAYQSLLSENQLKDFKTRGFYSEYFPEFNIRFINLLSAPMETMNFYLFVYKFDPTGQFQYMWDTLREAEKNGEHVFISVHIPPGGDGTHQLFDELFNDTVERFRNNIRGIFSGHTHIDELKWTRERADNSKIVHTNFVAGSLTTFGGMQPAFRVFEVDKDTGVIVDMIQYRLDLDKWNTMDPTIDPVWDVIYSFKTDYLMTDMSRASMQQLYDNLMNDRQPYLNKYFDHLRSGKPNSNNWKLKKLHLDSNDNLGLHCDFNTEVREYTKCLGWKLFTDYKSDWADIFVANMWTHYMKFN